MAAVPSLSEPQRSGGLHPAAPKPAATSTKGLQSSGDSHPAVVRLVEDVVAWQNTNDTRRIPKKFAQDSKERNLGMRFAKLLLRREKSLGAKPSEVQLSPVELALVNSVPGVPFRGCSVRSGLATKAVPQSIEASSDQPRSGGRHPAAENAENADARMLPLMLLPGCLCPADLDLQEVVTDVHRTSKIGLEELNAVLLHRLWFMSLLTPDMHPSVPQKLKAYTQPQTEWLAKAQTCRCERKPVTEQTNVDELYNLRCVLYADVAKYMVAVKEGDRLEDVATETFEKSTDETKRFEDSPDAQSRREEWWRELACARDVVHELLTWAHLLPVSTSSLDLLATWGIVCSSAYIPGSVCSTVDDFFILRHSTGFSSREVWQYSSYCSVEAMSTRLQSGGPHPAVVPFSALADSQYIYTDCHGYAAPRRFHHGFASCQCWSTPLVSVGLHHTEGTKLSYDDCLGILTKAAAVPDNRKVLERIGALKAMLPDMMNRPSEPRILEIGKLLGVCSQEAFCKGHIVYDRECSWIRCSEECHYVYSEIAPMDLLFQEVQNEFLLCMSALNIGGPTYPIFCHTGKPLRVMTRAVHSCKEQRW